MTDLDAHARTPVPPLRPDSPPLAFVVDYDGTISETDVTDAILDGFFGDWRWIKTGDRFGSRSFYARQVASFSGSVRDVVATAERQPHDPGFAAFVRRADELGVPVEVVSDGLGFFIAPALENLGVPHVPIVTALTTVEDGRARIEFPNGHPECFVCGTCKRQRVLAHRTAGRHVVVVGDGISDRFGAAYADLVLAKRGLVRFCEADGIPCETWDDFADVTTRLEELVEAWRADPGSLPSAGARPHICGPEVWGRGATSAPIGEV
jgi:2-hydroxy-3-keto-5-methylthiopentenyl-1-phosphate phosphatase